MAVQVTMKNSHQPAASIPRVPMAASMRMIRPRAFRLGNDDPEVVAAIPYQMGCQADL